MRFEAKPLTASQINRQPLDAADHDLERRVTTFLSTRHHPGLRRLSVEARGGVVTIRGKVASFYEKQLSSQLAQHVAGVVRLVDDIVVSQGRNDRRQQAGLNGPTAATSIAPAIA